MRYLSIFSIVALSCQFASGQQPSAKELIAKFRSSIGDEATSKSIAFSIEFTGENYLYSLTAGRLRADVYPLRGKLMGYTDQPDKHRKETEMKIGIVPVKLVEVVNKDTGWYQFNDGEAVMLSKEQIQGMRQREIHVEVFLGRESFGSAAWQFSQPQGSQVRGQDAWKIEGKANSVGPITLYFSKDTGLLLRLSANATDFSLLPGSEAKLETFVRDIYIDGWKKLGNRMLPQRLRVYHDNVLSMMLQAPELSFRKEWGADLFTAPKAKN